MAEHRRTELVVEALEMAIWQHQPALGLVHHSDQARRTRAAVRAALPRAGIDVSMGAKGSALDNAACDSFSPL